MTESRIYVVTDQGGTNRLIRASHPSQAVRHAAREAFKARVATQDDLVALLPTLPVESADDAPIRTKAIIHEALTGAEHIEIEEVA